MKIILDLRIRCKRCNKIIFKNKIARNNYERYKPFCGYQCQELYNLESIQDYINNYDNNTGDVGLL